MWLPSLLETVTGQKYHCTCLLFIAYNSCRLLSGIIFRSACLRHRKERTRYMGIQLSRNRRGMLVRKILLYNIAASRKTFYKLVLKRICTFIALLAKLHNFPTDISRSFVTTKNSSHSIRTSEGVFDILFLILFCVLLQISYTHTKTALPHWIKTQRLLQKSYNPEAEFSSNDFSQSAR